MQSDSTGTLGQQGHPASFQGVNPPKFAPSDRRRILSDAEQGILLDHIIFLGSKHLYPTPDILRNMAAENPGHRPGPTWTQDFVKRHQDRVRSIMMAR
jgi:hypothetical protein